MKQEKIGITTSVTQGQEPVPVYHSDSGTPAFYSDDPYLLSDGKSLVELWPVVWSDGPFYVDSFGNAKDAVPLSGDVGPSVDTTLILDFQNDYYAQGEALDG